MITYNLNENGIVEKTEEVKTTFSLTLLENEVTMLAEEIRTLTAKKLKIEKEILTIKESAK